MTMNSSLDFLKMEQQLGFGMDSESDNGKKMDAQLNGQPNHNQDDFNWSTMKSILLNETRAILKLEEEQKQLKHKMRSIQTAAKALEGANEGSVDENKLHCDNNFKKDKGHGEISQTWSIRCSQLLENSSSCILKSKNPMIILSKLLAIKEIDPLLGAPQMLQLITKQTVSINELSHREDNIINMQINRREHIKEFADMTEEEKRNFHLNPFLHESDIVVVHSAKEFFTFCLCDNCEEYRELVFRLMVDHFKATQMVVMLLDVVVKAYKSMLNNTTASRTFDKLFNNSKKIFWITTGFYYHQMSKQMSFIYDERLSDQMKFVLLSSILTVNNPMLLLQILAFHVECVVKAFAEGFLEIVHPGHALTSIEVLNYLLNGYDEMMRIANHMASNLFAFENGFLKTFTLTWKLLCQRLYQQHVYLNLTETMLACLIRLKNEELTPHNSAIIKRYIQFDDIMNFVEKRWTEVWCELNKYNQTDVERERREGVMKIFQIFNTVKKDSMEFTLPETTPTDNVAALKNNRFIWYRIMTYAKNKWLKGFFEPPNTLIVEPKCSKCGNELEYHSEDCKCITCSIAGGPLPPKAKEANGLCSRCWPLDENEMMNMYESAILNVCTKGDFLYAVKRLNNSNNNEIKRTVGLQTDNILINPNPINITEQEENKMSYEYEDTEETDPPCYHIAWAVFHHLNDRKQYPYESIEACHFCNECQLPACQLATEILANEIPYDLAVELLQHYQPILINHEEIRHLLPNIMLYNDKLTAAYDHTCDADFDDVLSSHYYLLKVYWIYVISIYATYFLETDPECCKTLNLESLELSNNDIRINVDRLKAKRDIKTFREFLNTIKNLCPQAYFLKFSNEAEVGTYDMGSKLNELPCMPHAFENCAGLSESISPPTGKRTDDALKTNTKPIQPKKEYKDAATTCCFDHKEFGEHTKESHVHKKRLKKDCSHARKNETRERLRKKLSHKVNARKNILMKATTSAVSSTNESQPQTNEIQQAAVHNQPCRHKLLVHCPTSSTAAAVIADVVGGRTTLNDSCTNTEPLLLARCCKHSTNHSIKCVNGLSNQIHTCNHSDRINSQKKQTQQQSDNSHENCCTKNKQTVKTSANGTTSSKPSDGLEFVNEVCDMIDKYSKEPINEKKWIKETLNFIEGSSNVRSSHNGNTKKAQQPQTTNPKKAAKKAKQKQRKEEMKRIEELKDLRGQFENIYFKEFTEKHTLKLMKANNKKQRDKKRINELETNIKNLQRAKAKVECHILELIATVKQTNSEFKFPYLPTREQQLEKLKEWEMKNCDNKTKTTNNNNNNGNDNDNDNDNSNNVAEAVLEETQWSGKIHPNDINIHHENYAIPYAQANQFPIQLGGVATPPPPPLYNNAINSSPYDGFIRSSPIYYAPPQQQQQQTSAPNILAATATGNIPTPTPSNNTTTDPSKRIVTIRRVNLPNVPEPQVTVTARGTSPDKDKLLYTLINGQIKPTADNQASSSTKVEKNSTQNTTVQQPPSLSTAVDNNNLTKSQLKKARRRLANFHLNDAQQLPKTQYSKIENTKKDEQQQQQQIIRKKDAVETNNARPATGSKSLNGKKTTLNTMTMNESCSNSPMLIDEMESSMSKEMPSVQQSQNKKSLKKKKKNLAAAPAPAVISKNDSDSNVEFALYRETYNNHNQQQQQQQQRTTKLKHSRNVNNNGTNSTFLNERSDSRITTYSATTSVSSKSASSQMNTRENSLNNNLKLMEIQQNCSNKNSVKNEKMMNLGQKLLKKQQEKAMADNVKMKAGDKKSKSASTKHQQQQQQQSNLRSTSSETNEHITSTKSVLMRKDNLPGEEHNTTTQKLLQKSNNNKNKLLTCPPPPPHTDTNQPTKDTNNSAEKEPRQPRLIVDNGQFDNNPFKSLHIQESDSDVETIQSDHTNNTGEDIMQRPENQQQVQLNKTQRKADQSWLAATTTNTTIAASAETSSTKLQKKLSNCTNQGRSNITNNNNNSGIHIKSEQNTVMVKKSNQMNSKKKLQQKWDENEKEAKNASAAEKQRLKKKKKENVCESDVPACPNNDENKNQLVGKAAKIKGDHPKQQQQQRNGLNSQLIGADGYANGNKYSMADKPAEVWSSAKQCSAIKRGAQLNKNSKQKQSNYNLTKNQYQTEERTDGIQQTMDYNITQSYAATPTETGTHSHFTNMLNKMDTASLTARNNKKGYQTKKPSTNISIMDQLNQGVQVENLSLPPGITLTKVDPIKSEQLRQKSESIQKLAKPLQQQHQQPTQTYHHAGATIIAPAVSPMTSYFGVPYGGPASTIDPQSGIIMVEGSPQAMGATLAPVSNTMLHNKYPTHNARTIAPTSSLSPSSSTKSSSCKNKKRRNNKSRTIRSCSHDADVSGEPNAAAMNNSEPKMVTLRNPMFQKGGAGGAGATTPAPAATTTLLHQPALLPGRSYDSYPLPLDQPAAIIKNENGMYTIRNPALHQAVTNGLTLGGYRQFGNITYYTPQEAIAAKHKQQQQQQDDSQRSKIGQSGNFSYFSNDDLTTAPAAAACHNNISLGCTSINKKHVANNSYGGGDSGDRELFSVVAAQSAAAQPHKGLSAIGSEMKNAQQQKQQKPNVKSQLWSLATAFNQTNNVNCNASVAALPITAPISCTSNATITGDLSLQQKYQQSKYYNGFENFVSNNCTSMHNHSCGDDSPPPSITNYTSTYLDGIPNTGVIRYDDASFLKNLIPGQNLNNEVSIHNVSDSHFSNRPNSTASQHCVEIRPVYGTKGKTLINAEMSALQPDRYFPSPLDSFHTAEATATTTVNFSRHCDPHNFTNTTPPNFPEYRSSRSLTLSGRNSALDSTPDIEAMNGHCSILDLNNILGNNGQNSQCVSPFLRHNSLEDFVQNINNLHISATPSPDEQISQLSGGNLTSSSNTSNGTDIWW